MTEANTSVANTETEQDSKVVFTVQKIYLKDVSFETPTGLEAFTKVLKPNIQQDVNIQVNPIQEGLFEVVLLITVTAVEDNKVLFLIEVKQGGLFVVAGIEGFQLAHAVNVLCPQIIFPYAREVLDNVLVKGGFPPLMLPPMNFEAVYAQAVMAAQKNDETAEKETVAAE